MDPMAFPAGRASHLAVCDLDKGRADKVAIRVSILVQFRVIDPEAAVHNVANYEERIYEAARQL